VVNYVKGQPTNVLEDDASSSQWGKRVIEVSKLDQGRTPSDFLEWSYKITSDDSRIDVVFDADKKVKSIQCYSNGYLNCPSVFGLHDGSTEDDVIARLGKPTSEAVNGVAKRMVYDPYNVMFYLTKKQVYMIYVTEDLPR
jgi:hypothetical protein